MADQGIIIRHNAAVSSSVPYTIDLGVGVQRIYITAITQDVLVEFNGSANSDSFRIVAGTQPALLDFRGSNVRKISMLAATATSNVYVMGLVA